MNKTLIKTIYASDAQDLQQKIYCAAMLDFWIEVKQRLREPDKNNWQYEIELYTMPEGDEEDEEIFI